MATQNSINSPIPFAASKGGTGLVSPTNHGIMVGQGASPMLALVLADFQVLVGETGAAPTARTITAGSGIGLDFTTPGVLAINNTSSGGATVDVVTGTQAVAVDTTYITTNATLVTYTLPGTFAVGAEIEIVGEGAGGWLLAQPAGVDVKFGDVATTPGVTGSLASTDAGDVVRLKAVVANTTWRVVSSVGNITFV